MHFFKKVITTLLIISIIGIAGGCSSSKDTKGVYKISEEKNIAKYNNVTITVSPYDLEEASKVTIKEVDPKSLITEEDLSDELKIVAYDFSLDNKEEFIDLIEISIPYEESFIENGEDESACISGMYFNEEKQDWEEVDYWVDTENKVVNITTNHLSTYGVFTVKNENSRAAKIIKVNYLTPVVNSDVSSEIINECLNNGMSPGEKATGLGLTVTGDWLGISGGLITTLTETVYSTQLIKDIGGAITNVGLAAAFAQAAYDFHKGDDVALYGNLTKNLSYFTVSKWGSRALQLSFVGVYAIDYSLNKFATEAWQGRDDIWYEAYKIYYEREGKRTAREWYKKFYWMWQDSINEKNPVKLSEQINSALDEYCNEFWRLPESDIAFYQSEAMNSGFSIGGGLNDKLKKDISKAAKAELVKVLQTPVFDRLESKISMHLKDEYRKELQDLKVKLNQVISFQLVEVLEEGEKPQYGNHIVRFAPLSNDANVATWTGKTKEDGTANTKFTLLGHLQSGSPNTIEIFAPDSDPDVDEPVKIVNFKISIPETVVEIGKYPPLEELVGRWDSTITFEKVDIKNVDSLTPENIDTENVEGCDEFDIDPNTITSMLKEYEGKSMPVNLIINATSENTGTIGMVSEDDDEPEVFNFEYKNGRIYAIENYGIENLVIDIKAKYYGTGIKLDGYFNVKGDALEMDLKVISQR